MVFKVIEAFSGIGSQAKALDKIAKKNPQFSYNIEATIEWEIGAMYAYDIIHHGPQNHTKYTSSTKTELVERLQSFNLSSDGKQPLKKDSIQRMPINQLMAICHSIDSNKNLVDISSVKAKDLPEADLLTYSFPCQDLSISSYWHGNFSGIDKAAGNRSGLLWEVERILNEFEDTGQTMPRFLLMENVSAIHGTLHEKNFKLWRHELERLGYTNKYYDLDASDFGIPQSRLRTFMISIYTADLHQAKKDYILRYFESSTLDNVTSNPRINNFLRLDYSVEKYRKEAIESTPNNTYSRERIGQRSLPLAYGSVPTKNVAKTITTKQDRFPNAGIIFHESNFGENKAVYRNLTPRETFLLMGFEESDFQRLIDNNISITKSRKMLSHSKLLKLSGNSIVVDVLQKIFEELLEIKDKVIDPNSNIIFLEQKML